MAVIPIENDHVRRWVTAYLEAWTSNDPDDVGALFSDDASYRAQPESPPTVGRAAIVKKWIKHGDAPRTWHAAFEPMLVHERTAIVTGTVDYDNGRRFINLWVIHFGDDGRCADFTEWWRSRGKR